MEFVATGACKRLENLALPKNLVEELFDETAKLLNKNR